MYQCINSRHLESVLQSGVHRSISMRASSELSRKTLFICFVVSNVVLFVDRVMFRLDC
jgi:hypothetical protein